MKKPAIQFLLALGLGLSALSMSASALDYGILRPRSTVDSTGLPSLNGIPPTDTGRPQVGGALGTFAAVGLTYYVGGYSNGGEGGGVSGSYGTANSGWQNYSCVWGMGYQGLKGPFIGPGNTVLTQLCPAGSGAIYY